MRKQEIILTTPEQATAYAIGTIPETGYKVWEDPTRGYANRNYTPGYVLGAKEGGFVLALTARHYPDTERAKYQEQATAEEALGYTLQDYKARQEVLADYSKGAWSQEKSAARQAALDKLKPIPKCWSVTLIRTADVRMLWAEYVTRLDAAISDRADAAIRQKMEKEAKQTRRMELVRRIADLNIGLDEAGAKWAVNHFANEVTLPTDVVEALLDGYVAPTAEAEEVV